MSARTWSYALTMLACVASVVGAQTAPLSMSHAITLARERAPAVVSARARLAEARAAQVGAAMRLDNPELDVSVGPRFVAGGDTLVDFSAGITQAFERASRRDARRLIAATGVESAEAALVAAERVAIRDASRALLEVQFLQQHLALMREALGVATEAQQVAERRFALGDVAVLDVNTAKVERTRLEAEVDVLDADRLAALGTLAVLVGADTLPVVTEAPPRGADRDLSELLTAVANRPELRMIDADIRQAEARLRLAASAGKPAYGVAARYDRDEGDHVVLGGITITLPAFNKGQDVTADAIARLGALRLERTTTITAWTALVRARFAGLQAQRRALARIERDALPAALDNETLARRSYEAGQISLIDWMVLRREALQLRRDYLARVRDIAIAGVELDAMAGVIP